jgi:hypothetical protein
MNTTKVHTIKMRLATIDIKLMDLSNKAERIQTQQKGLEDVRNALKAQLDVMLLSEEKTQTAIVQEPE